MTIMYKSMSHDQERYLEHFSIKISRKARTWIQMSMDTGNRHAILQSEITIGGGQVWVPAPQWSDEYHRPHTAHFALRAINSCVVMPSPLQYRSLASWVATSFPLLCVHRLMRHEINPSVNELKLFHGQTWTEKHVLRIICGPGGKPVFVFCFFLAGPSSSEIVRSTVALEEPSTLALETGTGLGATFAFLLGWRTSKRSQESGVGLSRLAEARMAESKTVRNRGNLCDVNDYLSDFSVVWLFWRRL